MHAPAFLGAPQKLSFSPRRVPVRPPTSTRRPPTCGLKELATAAAAAVTLSISALPIQPSLSDSLPQHRPQHSLVINTAHTNSHASHPLVVGVGKAAIHDYSYDTSARGIDPVNEVTVARSVEQGQVDDDAQHEFSLAVRLVTAVLLGVMLGVERRATSLNLGVRSITLISLCAAMAALMGTGAESGVHIPLISQAPHVTIVSAATISGLAVYAAARLRRRKTRHAAAMCIMIGLDAAMGGACGAGLSLLTVGCYLAAVAVMRSNGGRRDRVRVVDSSVVHGDGVGVGHFRMGLEPVTNIGDGKGDAFMDGSSGFSSM